MAGHEDQPEQVVGQVGVDDLVHVGLEGCRRWDDQRRHQPVLATLGVPAADQVHRQVLSGRRQPTRRILRDAGRTPLLQRGNENVLRDLLRCVQITDQPHQPGDQPRRLHAPQRGQPAIQLAADEIASAARALHRHCRGRCLPGPGLQILQLDHLADVDPIRSDQQGERPGVLDGFGQ